MYPTMSEIPSSLKESLSQRDQTPMGKDSWIKVQYISLMPGIAKNYRYHLMQDGRLYYAANTGAFPEDHSQVFNVEMPNQPVRTLAEESLLDLQEAIEEIDYFNQETYQESPSRDGRLMIVTVRQDEQVHEVWYLNTHNVFTDLLQSISPEEPVQPDASQELADLQDLLKQQKDLADQLGEDQTDSAGNSID